MNIEKVVRRAIELGASEAEAMLLKSSETSLKLSDVVEASKHIKIASLGVRVAVGKSTAVVGTRDISEDGIEKAVGSAVSIAKVSPQDPYWVSMNRNIGFTRIGDLFDKDTAEAPPEQLLPLAKELLGSVKEGCSEAKPVDGLITASSAEVVYANAYGGPVEWKETTAVLYVEARVDEAGSVGNYSDFDISRGLGGLKAREIGLNVGSKAKVFVKAGSIGTDRYELILLNDVSNSIVPVMLAPAISAFNVQQGRSPLAEKVGTSIMSEQITIEDLGASANVLGASPFDGEGFPTRNLIVVERGVLNTFLYDTYTANREGKESTGNASRNYDSSPRPSPHHLFIKPGSATLEEMIRETKNGIFVARTIGQWLSNPISGHMNATITHAYMVRNGELTEPVKNGVISGDFYETFKDGLEVIGNDIKQSSGVSTPSLKFRNILIASK
ncbi:MAG: TldD/PmbA family protein [Thermoproteota archaeon]